MLGKCHGSYLHTYTFFSMQKSPLYVGGTESSDRSSLTAEPPFLSGQMVCRDPIDNEGGEKNGNEIIHGSDVESYTSESGKCFAVNQTLYIV